MGDALYPASCRATTQAKHHLIGESVRRITAGIRESQIERDQATSLGLDHGRDFGIRSSGETLLVNGDCAMPRGGQLSYDAGVDVFVELEPHDERASGRMRSPASQAP